jgi:hypothetical protein
LFTPLTPFTTRASAWAAFRCVTVFTRPRRVTTPSWVSTTIFKPFSVELALNRDLTAVEIERSEAACEADLPVELAVPLLVPPPEEVELLPPERAAPPNMATAQPDSSAVAIIPTIRGFAQAFAANFASTFT